MGRAPCCAKVGLHRGPWTSQEDSLLINYIRAHGEGLWRSLPKKAGLLRCGKSCRLRWLNYLRPDIKRGNISPEEEDLIIRLHALLGNKWSLIAGRLPGRTDNEIKNYWNTHLGKKLSELPPKRKRSNTKKEKSSKTGNGRPHVHIPKPVRVKSLTSLKRNNSLESSVTDVSASTREGSAYWPSDPYAGPGGVRFLRGGCGADDDLANVTLHPLASDLDKLYEEYLQLLKSDDDHDYLDHNQARELDCFAESLLI